ncbi:MAG: pentapeptide repeat-containing protein [Gammaproteobacteria bacterium]|nr:pentapeptide repeat-containing protein [Gammaproteobacteria bacterium]
MSEQAADTRQIWFLRVEGAQLGPYSSARIRSLLTNGELSLQAEISRDKRNWQKIHRVAEVVPMKLRAQLGDRSAQSLVHARRINEQQTGTGERRGFPVVALSVTLLLISAVLALSLWSGLPQEQNAADCSAKAAPRVNWRHCVMRGIDVGDASLAGANLDSAILREAKLTATDLSGANLRYADLSGADMSYAQLNRAALIGANLQGANLAEADLTDTDLRFADLSGVRLQGALLSRTRFDEAIWIDGKPCAAGSVGECRR